MHVTLDKNRGKLPKNCVSVSIELTLRSSLLVENIRNMKQNDGKGPIKTNPTVSDLTLAAPIVKV